MKFHLPHRTPARLGIATGKREYDLPFNDDSAGRFLVLLIGLMTYLALLSAAAGMVLTSMADRWTTGLANHITVEIPALDITGVRLADAQHTEKTKEIESFLLSDPDVAEVVVQPPSEVGKLVEPWLGSDGQVLGQVPLPALISVTTKSNDPAVVTRLKGGIEKMFAAARIETHQSWLNDVLRLTSTLSFAAYLIGLITAVTTVSAVGGAVRARMSAFREQLEILHLIGASDEYITRQFQKHALHLSFIGAGTGFVLSMITLALLDNLAGTMEMALVPTLILSGQSFLVLLIIPALTCVITVFTTRLTVLQSLQDMP